MRFWQLTCFAVVFAASPLCIAVVTKMPTDPTNLVEDGVTEQASSFFVLAARPATFSQRFSLLLQEEESVADSADDKQAGLEQEDFSLRDRSDDATSHEMHSSYLGLDPDAASPQDKKRPISFWIR